MSANFHSTLFRCNYAESTTFLEALLRGAPDDHYLEFRTFAADQETSQAFHRISDVRRNPAQILPVESDGKTNVYYGVCPRARKRGRNPDVTMAGVVWFDEITKPPPDSLLPFSFMLETSIGKIQGGYFLEEYTPDVDRVSRLSQRLGKSVGGDNVHDRARVLRLPGFKNVKYDGQPRAHLVEFHPDRRYSLEELDRAIPELPQAAGDQPQREYAGLFNPHWGESLSNADQATFEGFLRDCGLALNYDGRFFGPCPLDHRGTACDCDSAFYCSSRTGNWSCFCSDHPRADVRSPVSGSIRAFVDIGFTPSATTIRDELSFKEMKGFVDSDASRDTGLRNSDFTVERKKPLTTLKPEKNSRPRSFAQDRPKRDRGDALWDYIIERLPYPSDRPWTKSALLHSELAQSAVLANFLQDTWLRPWNAQHKRHRLFVASKPAMATSRARKLEALKLYERIAGAHASTLPELRTYQRLTVLGYTEADLPSELLPVAWAARLKSWGFPILADLESLEGLDAAEADKVVAKSADDVRHKINHLRKFQKNLAQNHDGDLFLLEVPFDDWSDDEHKKILNKISYRGGEYICFDNVEKWGCNRYLSDCMPDSRWHPVGDLNALDELLIVCLSGINPPDPKIWEQAVADLISRRFGYKESSMSEDDSQKPREIPYIDVAAAAAAGFTDLLLAAGFDQDQIAAAISNPSVEFVEAKRPRFRPIGASNAWSLSTLEPDRGLWTVIARGGNAGDFNAAEVEAVGMGKKTSYANEIYWKRSQIGQGLRIEGVTLEETQKIAIGAGLVPVKKAETAVMAL